VAIVDVQNFNFVSKFVQNGSILAPRFAFLGKIVLTNFGVRIALCRYVGFISPSSKIIPNFHNPY